MKFGKQYDFHKIPEWAEHYFDYNSLKKLLKSFHKKHLNNIINRRMRKLTKRLNKEKEKKQSKEEKNEKLLQGNFTDSNENKVFPDSMENNIMEVNNASSHDHEANIHEENNPMENKEAFIEAFKEKIKTVEDFFMKEITALNIGFIKLKGKMDERKSSIISILDTKSKFKHNDHLRESISRENAERDELGYAVSWKRAFSQLYNLISWLHSYCVINSLACQKILKKFNKIMLEQGVEHADVELNEYFKNLQFMTKIKNVIDLRKQIKIFYANDFTEGNLKKAEKDLESRMRGNKTKHTAMIAFYGGMIVSCLLALLLLTMIPESYTFGSDSLYVFFPLFSFTFILILALIGVSVNIFILRHFRINYIYIFEVDPKKRLGFNELFKTSLFLLTVWFMLLMCMKTSLSFSLFADKFFIFPMILICFLTLFLFWPFHIFYHEFRTSILVTFIKNIFPIGRGGVRFRDFMLGDILTSMTKPFASLSIGLCLLSCDECRDENIRSTCTRNSVSVLILTLSPFIFRLFQCINRWYYTKMAWPHLGNAVKYCGGILYNLFSWMFTVYKDEYLWHFLIFGIIANSYMLFWDIYMDWNLGRLTSTNFFLRDKIVYPKWMYYSAIGINSLLRFTWLTSLPGVNLYIDDELKILILSVLEIYRRTQWSLFRIENENTNNPEKYRAILAIPELPYD